MKKTTVLDMSAFVANYTAKVIAEEKARIAYRDAVLAGEVTPTPTTVWCISDRH